MVSIGGSLGGSIGGALGGGLGAATATVRATIKVGMMGMPLRPDIEPLVQRVVVDNHVHLPDMFEITFLDESGSVVDDANLSIGTEVAIFGGAADSQSADKLIDGEVTSIEAICENLFIYTVVRGYEKAHRLQRARRSRTFVDMTDSAIARQIASDAGLDTGTIDSTNTSHNHVAQVAQTDWEFLKQRARENGFETGVAGGEFFFRRPPGMPEAGGGLLGAVGSAASGMVDSLMGDGPPTLTFKQDLVSFYPRVSAANLTPEVEVRMWDPKDAKVVVGKSDSKSVTASLPDKPADLAEQFGKGFLGLPISIPPIPGLPNLGQAPSSKAFLVTNRPAGWGSSASDSADEMAVGVAEHVASTFAEAEGLAVGNPKIKAGKKVTVKDVPKSFAGDWMVTNAQHIFDDERGGYHTRFFVSGRHDRSLLGLASNGATQDTRGTIPGLVMGVVTNNNDPDTLGRVKVALPWLAPDFETDWARVAQASIGKKYGTLFIPDVGDEVLVGFEFGDVRRPYVIGGLINGDCEHDWLSGAVKSMGFLTNVVQSGYISRQGHKLLFDDDGLPMGSTSAITLGTKDDKLGLKIDQVNGTIELTCDPAPPASQTPQGTLTIKTGNLGEIDIKTGSGGQINIDGGAQLTLKAMTSISIESQATVAIKGQMITLGS
ncbi:MAG TPA: phage baseplate assembly protein V [Acidimicrobiia bacterium]|nr:phage baseplate assembly protein V [Acidimicrobiia bacterium]